MRYTKIIHTKCKHSMQHKAHTRYASTNKQDTQKVYTQGPLYVPCTMDFVYAPFRVYCVCVPHLFACVVYIMLAPCVYFFFRYLLRVPCMCTLHVSDMVDTYRYTYNVHTSCTKLVCTLYVYLTCVVLVPYVCTLYMYLICVNT